MSTVYSDGPIEDELLTLCSEGDLSESAVAVLLNKDKRWPLLYHLSPVRHNLLSWYDFEKSATLLEIGAGCGALTGLFCRKVAKVTALELSPKRAEITSNRHRGYNNLRVLAGNLSELNSSESFDYVTCVGVLEYSKRFFSPEPADLNFLKTARSLLKPNGTLIIGIENKFGLKYWAGAQEDHTGEFFASIQNYPNHPDIMTYSKPELEKLLQLSGFRSTQFYYPIPDYKLPIEIFSEKYPPSENHRIHPGLLPTPEFAYDRQFFFDERRVADAIIEGADFDFFSNSFLVFASL